MASDTFTLKITSDKPFYCYMYCDPRPDKNNQPIYVGKGVVVSRRAEYHWIKGTSNSLFRKVLDKIRLAGLVPLIRIIAYCDTNDEACFIEMGMISKIGRRNLSTGPLTNLTDGGEGIVGLIHTDEHRRKNSVSKKKRWADPDVYEKWLEVARPNLDIGRYDPAVRKKMTATLLVTKAELRADPVRSQQQSEQRSILRTEAWAKPEIREKYTASSRAAKPSKSTKMLAHWDDPEYYAAHAPNVGAAARASWDNPESRASRSAAIRVGKKAKAAETSVTMSAIWADPIKKAAINAKRAATRVANKAKKAEEEAAEAVAILKLDDAA